VGTRPPDSPPNAVAAGASGARPALAVVGELPLPAREQVAERRALVDAQLRLLHGCIADAMAEGDHQAVRRLHQRAIEVIEGEG
jgi:hypothetical protein